MKFERAALPPIDRAEFIAKIRAAGYSKVEAQRQYARLMNDVVWLSEDYQVNVEWVNSPIGELTHLSVKRRDKAPIRDWRDMQAIKNALCGPEREACELYPAESRLVDAANQYHLWVLPAGAKFPFGYDQGRAVDDSGAFGATQRPLTAAGPETLVGTHRGKITIVDDVTTDLRHGVSAETHLNLTLCTRCGHTLIDGRGGCKGAQHGNIGCAMNGTPPHPVITPPYRGPKEA